MNDATQTFTSTSDLHDDNPEQVRVVDLQFRCFGRIARFSGRCVPLASPGSHRPVLAALREEGMGRVLVVDGEGLMTIGLMGDRLAAIAIEKGWAGVILNGVIRDSAVIDRMEIGIRALGTTARRNPDEAEALPGPVTFGGVTFGERDWIYADEDAVIVSDTRLDAAAPAP